MSDKEPVSREECALKHESIDEMKHDVKALIKATTALETITGAIAESMKNFLDKEDTKVEMRQCHSNSITKLKGQTFYQWWVIGVGFPFVFGILAWILKTIYSLSQTVSALQHAVTQVVK